jgi:hypothetical protein
MATNKGAKTMTATAINDALTVLELVTLPDGVTVATVPCQDYDAKRRLPKAIRLGSSVLGCSGWNSDRCVAYFRTDCLVAVPA